MDGDDYEDTDRLPLDHLDVIVAVMVVLSGFTLLVLVALNSVRP